MNRWILAMWLAVLIEGRGAFAQEEPSEPIPVPPEIALGVRVESVRRRLPVVPVVVVVRDARSYVAAIGGWSLDGRYPVLIDTGTLRAAEDIGRFVRAFEPDAVVTWNADIPAEPWEVESAALEALCRAWGVEGEPSVEALRAAWEGLGFVPPGVVVASGQDGAWTAAVALAAGRGQPIIWLAGLDQHVNRSATRSAVEGLASKIERACEQTGFKWRELGDAIDAVSLCLNMPVRYALSGKDEAALTDRIGRIDGGVQRWAWAGQIFGNESRAAYRAMCGLFLPVRTAWLFDGYQPDRPWSSYDMTPAAEGLRTGGIETTLFDTPRQGEHDWRLAASRPLGADLVLINSSGNRGFFDLRPGRCVSGDVPILDRPTIVHMVHSWSAVAPGRVETVAGRWLQRGAYAYAGAVQEPYLSAFVTNDLLVRRLLAPTPMGVAMRQTGSPLWKITFLGDPLITFGPPATRVESTPPLDDAENLSQRLSRVLRQKRYAEAARVLVMLGRDGDAVRLAAGVQRDEPTAFDEALAQTLVFPSFRTGNTELLIKAFERLSPAAAGRESRRDALWNALWPKLTGRPHADVLGLLERNIRDDNVARDAIDLAGAMRRAFGGDRARAVLMAARARVKDQRSIKLLDAAMRGRR